MCSRSSPRPRRLAFGPFGSLQTRSTLEALPRRAKAEATGNARDRILQNRGMVRKLPRSGSPAGTGSARHLTGGGGAWLTGLDWLIGYGYYPVRAIGWAIVTLTRLLSSCAESLAVAILHSWSNGPRREALSERSASGPIAMRSLRHRRRAPATRSRLAKILGPSQVFKSARERSTPEARGMRLLRGLVVT